MTPPSSPPPALVLDASVAVSITSKEAATSAKASTELTRYLASGYEVFAPGVIVAETLYVLCGKVQDGSLSAADHAQAVADFHTMMASFVLPPPGGEAALIARAEAIRGATLAGARPTASISPWQRRWPSTGLRCSSPSTRTCRSRR